MVIDKIEPTMEEADFLVDASAALYKGETVYCPHCGKPLIYEAGRSWFEVRCSDENCISVSLRGI